MTRYLKAITKTVAACVILGFLLVQVQKQDGFSRLIEQEKNWTFLALGITCIFVSVTLSFLRWYILVRAMGLPFRMLDALRLGFLGFALNFVALGNVGGDVFKAIFIAKDLPGNRTKAVTTVIVDRVFGLFTMLVFASCILLVLDFGEEPLLTIEILRQLTLVCTTLGFVGIVVLLSLPSSMADRFAKLLSRLPIVGHVASDIVHAVASYRHKKLHLLSAFVMSLICDGFFVLSFFFIASGLPVHTPTLAEHCLIVPLSLIAGAIPVTPSGIGTVEAAVEALYQAVPSGPDITPGDGTIAALAQRVGMIMVAAIGMVFYIIQRSRLSNLSKPPAGEVASEPA